MSHIPANLQYTEQHEWVKLDGNVATVGITDFAQHALGDLVFVELPPKGKAVKAGDSFVVVESVKSASEVYAPVSGEVVDINEGLSSAPELINKAPYDDGWICKIKVSDPAEISKLLNAAQYQDVVS